MPPRRQSGLDRAQQAMGILQTAEAIENLKKQREAMDAEIRQRDDNFKLVQEKWTAERELMAVQQQTMQEQLKQAQFGSEQAEKKAKRAEGAIPHYGETAKRAMKLAAASATGDTEAMGAALDELGQYMSKPGVAEYGPELMQFLGAAGEAAFPSNVRSTIMAQLLAQQNAASKVKLTPIDSGKLDALDKAKQTVASDFGGIITTDGKFSSIKDVDAFFDTRQKEVQQQYAPLRDAISALAQMGAFSKSSADTLMAAMNSVNIPGARGNWGSTAVSMLQKELDNKSMSPSQRAQALQLAEQMQEAAGTLNNLGARRQATSTLLNYLNTAVNRTMTTTFMERNAAGDPDAVASAMTAGKQRISVDIVPVQRALADDAVARAYSVYVSTPLRFGASNQDLKDAQRTLAAAIANSPIADYDPAQRTKILQMLIGSHPDRPSSQE